MKSFFVIAILLFSISSKSQVFLGWNFNHFENSKSIIFQNSEKNFLPIEAIYGYKIQKKPYNVKLSYYMWNFKKTKDSIYYWLLPKETTEINYHTISFTVSKRIYIKDSLLPIYFNPGLKYSTSIGKDNLDNNYLMHGPGLDLAITGEFNSHMISIGVTETLEFMGTGTPRRRRSIYFSWQFLITKTMFNRKYLHKPF